MSKQSVQYHINWSMAIYILWLRNTLVYNICNHQIAFVYLKICVLSQRQIYSIYCVYKFVYLIISFIYNWNGEIKKQMTDKLQILNRIRINIERIAICTFWQHHTNHNTFWLGFFSIFLTHLLEYPYTHIFHNKFILIATSYHLIESNRTTQPKSKKIVNISDTIGGNSIWSGDFNNTWN